MSILTDFSLAPYHPNDIHGAQVLARCGRFGSDEAIVWEHSVAAGEAYPLRAHLHTVSLCNGQWVGVERQVSSSTALARGDEWGLLIFPADEGCLVPSRGAATLWNVSLSPSTLLRAQCNAPGASSAPPPRPPAAVACRGGRA